MSDQPGGGQEGVGRPDGLERIWTPHRMAYIRTASGEKDTTCPFCRIPDRDDGLVVATEEEVLAVLDDAEAIQRREEDLRAKIEAGSSLFDHLNYDEHLAALRDGRDSKLSFS